MPPRRVREVVVPVHHWSVHENLEHERFEHQGEPDMGMYLRNTALPAESGRLDLKRKVALAGITYPGTEGQASIPTKTKAFVGVDEKRTRSGSHGLPTARHPNALSGCSAPMYPQRKPFAHQRKTLSPLLLCASIGRSLQSTSTIFVRNFECFNSCL